MPNLAYQRSVKRERELVNEYRSRGYYAARSAGSKSPWDVWAVNPTTGDVRLIQVKTHKGGRGMVSKCTAHYPGDISEYLVKYGFKEV